MADLEQTAGDVVSGDGASVSEGTAGGTLTAGMPLYMDAADGNKLKAASVSTAITSNVVGIALHAAAAGQPVRYQTAGLINVGATLTLYHVYCVSDTPGSIRDAGDNISDDYICVLGVPYTPDLLRLAIGTSGNSASAWPPE